MSYDQEDIAFEKLLLMQQKMIPDGEVRTCALGVIFYLAYDYFE